MIDSVDSPQELPGAADWLLFIHHLPPEPAYFRVKVRRRLQDLGAVALKNSVYVLPYTDDAVEDFEWLQRLVVSEGGEATLCSAVFLEGVTDGEVEAMFRAQSDVEYAGIVDAARSLSGQSTVAELRRLRRQLARAAARDFFGADGAIVAEEAVRAVESEMAGGRSVRRESRGIVGDAPRGATWVTRSGVQVDRIASAWLIARFIDEHARFRFVAGRTTGPVAGEFRFDMFGGEFTHEGEDCTFEVLVRRFRPDDSALIAIGEIVHDIDCKDDRFEREEAAGVASLIRGIVATHESDEARLAAGIAIFDGLYAAFGGRGV